MLRCIAIIIILNITLIAKNDVDVMMALLNEAKSPNKSVDDYIELYKETNSTIFLRKALKLAYFKNLKDINKVLNIVNKSKIANDSEVLKIKINYFLRYKKYKDALRLTKELVRFDKDPDNFIFLGNLELRFNNIKDALNSYESAYNINHSDEALLKIVDIYINRFKNLNSATRILKSHQEIYGCGVLACNLLIDIYEGEKDYIALMKLYEDIYKKTGDRIYLNKILSFYEKRGELEKVIDLLKSTQNYDKLIEVYEKMGEFEKAYDLANLMYKDTNDYNYLAISTNLEYELAMPNISKNKLDEILLKFKSCLGKVKSASFYNDYGFLLINYNIDIKKGMDLIDKALLLSPKNPEFIQNLALGYYKNGDCIMARDLLKNIRYKDVDLDLYTKIKKCVKIQLRNARNKKIRSVI